jgi:hypothetical protein
LGIGPDWVAAVRGLGIPRAEKEIDKTNPISSFVFNKTKKKQTQISPSKANLATLG